MSESLSIPAPPRIITQDDYTGEGLRLREPETYAGIVKLLSLGLNKTEISAKLQVNWRTVKAVELACFPDIQSARETLVRKTIHAAFATLESVEKNAEAGKGTAIEYKFLIESVQTLSGEATQIVQHNHDFPALQDYNQSKQAPQGPIVDV